MEDSKRSIVISAADRRDNPQADGVAPMEQRVTPAPHGHRGELHPGWARPRPEHIPRPTYWPAVMGIGITMIGWGLITTPLISLVGLLLLGISLWAWIGEMLHEHE